MILRLFILRHREAEYFILTSLLHKNVPRSPGNFCILFYFPEIVHRLVRVML